MTAWGDTAEGILYDLLRTLPRCDHCPRAATHAVRRGEGRYCRDHAPPGCGAYPRADAVQRAERHFKLTP